MSSSTLRAISNFGFLSFFSIFLEKSLQGGKLHFLLSKKKKKEPSLEFDKNSLPPNKFTKESMKDGEEEVHQKQSIKFLPHKTLPALNMQIITDSNKHKVITVNEVYVLKRFPNKVGSKP